MTSAPCWMPGEKRTMVAGYNVVMRHRIVTLWQKLEAQQQAPALPNFSNPAEAARA